MFAELVHHRVGGAHHFEIGQHFSSAIRRIAAGACRTWATLGSKN